MYDLQNLSSKIILKLDKLFEIFQLPYHPSNKQISLPCPIHNGNNQKGLTIFLEEKNGLIGNFRCWTNHCEEIYGKSIIAFIYGILHQKDKTITRQQSIDWIYSFLGEKPSYFKTENDKDKYIWIEYNKIFTKNNISYSKQEDIRSYLKIPSEYYINRGFSNSILQKYEIGICYNKQNNMFMRSVLPLFNETGEYIIGCCGRSINEKCEKCNLFHYSKGDCPQNPLSYLYYCKWKNSKDFNSSHHFFNLWRAKPVINQEETVILCEGAGDTLKLEECNIHNSLSLFGCNLSDQQQIILERQNCRNIILALDKDKAGEKAKEIITKKLERMYNIYYLDYSGKDVGETPIEELQQKYRKIEEKL